MPRPRNHAAHWKVVLLVLAVCTGVVAARLALVLAPGVGSARRKPIMNEPARRQAEWRRILARYPVRDLHAPESERKRRREELLGVDPWTLPPEYRYAFLFTRLMMAVSEQLPPQHLDAILKRLMQTPRPGPGEVDSRRRRDLLDADLLYEMACILRTRGRAPGEGARPPQWTRARVLEMLRYVTENFPPNYLAVLRSRWLLYHMRSSGASPRRNIDALWELAAVDPGEVFSASRFDRTRLEIVSGREHLERHIAEVNPRTALTSIFTYVDALDTREEAVAEMERLRRAAPEDRRLCRSIDRWLARTSPGEGRR